MNIDCSTHVSKALVKTIRKCHSLQTGAREVYEINKEEVIKLCTGRIKERRPNYDLYTRISQIETEIKTYTSKKEFREILCPVKFYYSGKHIRFDIMKKLTPITGEKGVVDIIEFIKNSNFRNKKRFIMLFPKFIESFGLEYLDNKPYNEFIEIFKPDDFDSMCGELRDYHKFSSYGIDEDNNILLLDYGVEP